MKVGDIVWSLYVVVEKRGLLPKRKPGKVRLLSLNEDGSFQVKPPDGKTHRGREWTRKPGELFLTEDDAQASL